MTTTHTRPGGNPLQLKCENVIGDCELLQSLDGGLECFSLGRSTYRFPVAMRSNILTMQSRGRSARRIPHASTQSQTT